MINVTCVIEPQASALIGAWLLLESLREHATGTVSFWLTVVRREGLEDSILQAASGLGIAAAACRSSHDNPFLNKWLWLDGFEKLRRARRVAMMDWDMLLVSPSSIPGPFPGKIAARPNPVGLYASLLRRMPSRLFPPGSVVGRSTVPSSLNGGLLLASGSLLRRCSSRAIAYEAEIAARAPGAALWEREQLALSVAVGEIGFAGLPTEWNVTWRHRQLRKGVKLWHYSDASGIMQELKRTLHRPELALGCLRALKETYPEAVACFLRLYSRAIEQRWFHDLNRADPRHHAAKTHLQKTAAQRARFAVGR